MKLPCLLAIYLLGCATSVKGACEGNDSRCAGSNQGACSTLQGQGTTCHWESSGSSTDTTSSLEPEPEPASPYSTSLEAEPAPGLADPDTTSIEPDTTSTKPDSSGQGDCEGNDSRCAGSSQEKCTKLKKQGSDCRWIKGSISTQGDGGDCSGNDSRCATSHHAKCIGLSQRGSDCRWERSVSTSSSSGKCAGNDSRCNSRSEQSCNLDGADCKWRTDFTHAGFITLQVTNVSSFAENPNAKAAIKEGIANLTGVPSEYIDLDLYVVPQRRLEGRALAQTGTLIVTYVIVVGSHVPASVAVTGGEIGEVMKASNVAQIGAAITSKVKETFASDSFSVVVAEVAPIELTSSSVSTNTTTSVSSNSSSNSSFNSSSYSSLTSTTADPGLLTEDDGALLTGCAHPLLVLLGIAIYLF
jgi:hypothetical protein